MAKKKRSASVSRILSGTIIYPGESLATHALCSPPATPAGPALCGCLLGIAPKRVYPATFLADRAVGSYPTISPLPLGGGIFSVALSVARPKPNARELPGLLSCGVRTFLTPGLRGGRAARWSDAPRRVSNGGGLLLGKEFFLRPGSPGSTGGAPNQKTFDQETANHSDHTACMPGNKFP